MSNGCGCKPPEVTGTRNGYRCLPHRALKRVLVSWARVVGEGVVVDDAAFLEAIADAEVELGGAMYQ